MPIVRNCKDFSKLPPDVWVNELPVPQNEIIQMGDFVLAVIGNFQKGFTDQYIYVSESASRTLAEAVTEFLGAPSTTGKYPGNQVLEHIKNAKVKKCIFVNVRGKDAKTSSLIFKNNYGDILKITAKHGEGEYGNIYSGEIVQETDKLMLNLYNDLGKKEAYEVCMNPNEDIYIVNKINNTSKLFTASNLSAADSSNPIPEITPKTQFSGGTDGDTPTGEDYIGAFDPSTKKRTGLKLLETIGNVVTDVCYANYSSGKVSEEGLNPDDALAGFGSKYNCMTYCGVNNKTALNDIISYRKEYDTDYMQMVYGKYKSENGAEINGSTLSAIVHSISNVEDSGLSIECHWISASIDSTDIEQQYDLYENQIGAFVLKPSSKGDGSYAFRLLDDYTLAITDVDGSLIQNPENRKVNRRRINAWLEKSLFTVAAPWQGKALTKSMKEAAAIRIRTFLDQLKTPLTSSETSKIEDYSITFDENAANIDQFVNTLKIKHYNTAEWVILNYQGGTNVEV